MANPSPETLGNKLKALRYNSKIIENRIVYENAGFLFSFLTRYVMLSIACKDMKRIRLQLLLESAGNRVFFRLTHLTLLITSIILFFFFLQFHFTFLICLKSLIRLFVLFALFASPTSFASLSSISGLVRLNHPFRSNDLHAYLTSCNHMGMRHFCRCYSSCCDTSSANLRLRREGTCVPCSS